MHGMTIPTEQGKQMMVFSRDEKEIRKFNGNPWQIHVDIWQNQYNIVK